MEIGEQDRADLGGSPIRRQLSRGVAVRRRERDDVRRVTARPPDRDIVRRCPRRPRPDRLIPNRQLLGGRVEEGGRFRA